MSTVLFDGVGHSLVLFGKRHIGTLVIPHFGGNVLGLVIPVSLLKVWYHISLARH